MASQQSTTGESRSESALDRMLGDPALSVSAVVGGALFVIAWTSFGWSLPSTVEETVALGKMVGVIGVMLSLLVVVMLAPRLFAWQVLDSRVPDNGGRIDDRTEP